ncbi:MAG: hypothetical protein IPI81_16040 [Flavobacteriales bacterium]|nr:hypothetical protein [Flavobacteriales bacterium]
MNTLASTTLFTVTLGLLASCNNVPEPGATTSSTAIRDSTRGAQNDRATGRNIKKIIYGPAPYVPDSALGAGYDTLILSDADRALIARLKGADILTTKAYIRSVLHEDLPKDFVLPEIMKTAGSAQEAELIFKVRYPEFYGKQGREYLRAAADHPIRYRQLIRETRLVRQFYQKSNN